MFGKPKHLQMCNTYTPPEEKFVLISIVTHQTQSKLLKKLIIWKKKKKSTLNVIYHIAFARNTVSIKAAIYKIY